MLYRDQAEIDSWKSGNNPLTRLGLYLRKQGLRKFDDEDDKKFRKQVRDRVSAALKAGAECK